LAQKEPGVPEAVEAGPAGYLHWRVFGYSWVVWAGVVLFLAALGLIAAVFEMRG
jgi:hypothetical protein